MDLARAPRRAARKKGSGYENDLLCFLAIDNDIMRKMCTLITSKGTDIDENIANQNHATRTRTPKPGYLNLSIITRAQLES